VGFRLVPKSVTLNDVEGRNDGYLAFFFAEVGSFMDRLPLASQSDWGPLDILILGALHHEPCHINVGLNARPKGLRAVLHSII